MHHLIRGSLLALLFCVSSACQQNPGTMTQAQVETLLKEKLTGDFSTKELTLSPNPSGGGFTGSAVGTDGTKYKITVTQDPAARKLAYDVRSESDKDEFKQGEIVLK